MPIAPDHASNFPSEYSKCPKCGRKGVYYLAPSFTSDGVKANDEYWRCKYCNTFFETRPV